MNVVSMLTAGDITIGIIKAFSLTKDMIKNIFKD